jgi:putative ABC transport system permease protein
VLAYTVAQRTSEIGVRLALGAQTGDILRMILRDGAAVSVIGIVAGLAGSLALTRFLRSQLFEVSPLDFSTFAGAAALLCVVALAASYVPAKRATRVDAMVALRYE